MQFLQHLKLRPFLVVLFFQHLRTKALFLIPALIITSCSSQLAPSPASDSAFRLEFRFLGGRIWLSCERVFSLIWSCGLRSIHIGVPIFDVVAPTICPTPLGPDQRNISSSTTASRAFPSAPSSAEETSRRFPCTRRAISRALISRALHSPSANPSTHRDHP